MTQILERRGPEGTRHWHGAELSLGHTLLATTPEALVENLPLYDPRSGCAITADVRLDNREELLAALGITEKPDIVGDGRLILEAYLKWGDACLDHLLGDFAFALWDGRKRRLFCARDHFGMRPFNFFYDAGKLFAFASEPAAILALEGIEFRVNEERIADYLVDWEGADQTSTFFERIYRLPPAHRLVCEDGKLAVSRYFTLTAEKQLQLPSDEAYAEAFRDVFTDAIRCRLRSAGPVGSMLSGGLDSSSIVAVASELLAQAGRGPLHTFSAVGPDHECCIETGSVHAMLALPGLSPQLVDYSKLEPLIEKLETLTMQMGEPFDGHMTLQRAVYLAASRSGVKVVLDGGASDTVLSHGTHISHLIRAGRFLQAMKDARGEERFWGDSWPAWKTLSQAFRNAFVPAWVRSIKALLKSGQDETLPASSICSASFAKRTSVIARLREQRSKSPRRMLEYGEERVLTVAHPNLTVGRERYDRTASTLAVEPRDPFLDLRLVTFCLSLPGDQLERDGWPKFILRNAIKGRLPPEVCWRLGKDHLGVKFTKALFTEWPDILPDGKFMQSYIEASDTHTILVDNAGTDLVYLKKLYLSLWMEFGASRCQRLGE